MLDRGQILYDNKALLEVLKDFHVHEPYTPGQVAEAIAEKFMLALNRMDPNDPIFSSDETIREQEKDRYYRVVLLMRTVLDKNERYGNGDKRFPLNFDELRRLLLESGSKEGEGFLSKLNPWRYYLRYMGVGEDIRADDLYGWEDQSGVTDQLFKEINRLLSEARGFTV